MRDLIVTAFVSLDGVMQDPEWTYTTVKPVPEMYENKGREQEEAGALLLGRRSYEEFAPVWPTMTDEFPRYNAMPRYVVSTTLEQDDPGWPATILRSTDDVAALKESDGGPISVHGSASLGASLADAGLVDRYTLLVFPVLLGGGKKRLWSESVTEPRRLELVEHQLYRNGVQWVAYDVVR